MSKNHSSNFHSYSDSVAKSSQKRITGFEHKLSYRFYPHFHPYVDELDKRLIDDSVSGLQAADTTYRDKVVPSGKPKPEDYELYQTFFQDYNPNSDLVPNTEASPHPVKDLDFTSKGAYSVYNWELFYHAPLTIAIHLSKNQRFEEAQRWFHYIFDPTDDSDGSTPERFWKVKPFQTTDVKLIEEILINLATNPDDLATSAERTLQENTLQGIEEWEIKPFRPHVVARFRQTAYMFKTVMAYLDNLIAWGDTLFRQDTGESINEATQLYVLAANLLGPRPQAVPSKGSVRPQTYAAHREKWDDFSNILVELETGIPFDLAPFPNAAADMNQLSTLSSLGKTLYFCVPRNDKLLSYWDTVADRLFKIRNSLNIQGIFRQLPLFEPPIDPALLARATAAGLDVGAVISGINQPLPLIRFQVLVQKAAEICQEVKSLGNNLLSAIEKEDNEAIAVLRAQHERVILGLAETVKYSQWQEAIKTTAGLKQSLKNAIQRYSYYERLLGNSEKLLKAAEIFLESLGSILEPLVPAGLEKMQFTASEPELVPPHIEVDIAQDLSGEVSGKKLSTLEVEEMQKLKEAQEEEDSAAWKEKTAAGLRLLPEFGINFHYWGLGGHSLVSGGAALASAMSFWASFARTNADQLAYEANNAAKIGSYANRERDYAFQRNLAVADINQTYKQLTAAQIREYIANREWKNHQQQIRHAEEIEQFLTDEKKGKKTNQAFYTWMKREVRGLYGQVFQFAFDIAKKAERALQHELGDSQLSFLQLGYLSGKEGLLAGEKLYLDIKRMEMAYHDLNQREYELTKHVSLLQVNPEALLQLRTTGRCTVFLPEELFDMDGPGHYFRRIKSVAMSIPCVVGPYTSINCTLTLLKSSIRKNSLLRDGNYARQGTEDDRFSDYFGSLQSIVTSTGQNDSGLFETNLRDERYLPFEGSGVISEWQLQLPANPSKNEPCQFDYSTISDVIFHVRYTAREGGTLSRNGAINNLNTLIEAAKTVGSVRLFSVRHEFPSAWANFKQIKMSSSILTAELILEIRPEHFPYWSNGKLEHIKKVTLFTPKDTGFDSSTPQGSLETITYIPDGKEEIKKLANFTDSLPKPPFILRFKLQLGNNSMKDLWLALTWGT